jgi:cbb3-type cytochrome c oxidase subunit II
MANLPTVKHQKIERNATLLLALSFLVVTVGGIVEIAPLFYLENTIEDVEGMRPYSPLELAGRDIYIREGCYVCHSQMIRPMRDEVERYGHYSLAAESSTIIRSSGAPSGRGPTSPASAGATRTTGMSIT